MSLFQQTFPTVAQIGLLANGEALPPVVTSVVGGATAAATGVTHIVASTAVTAGHCVALLGVILSSNGAVVGNFQSSSTPSIASGNFYLAANSTVAIAASALPYFVTAVGEGLDWSQAGSFAVGITAVWCTFAPTPL